LGLLLLSESKSDPLGSGETESSPERLGEAEPSPGGSGEVGPVPEGSSELETLLVAAELAAATLAIVLDGLRLMSFNSCLMVP
jgi:hypothetical protein